MDSESNCNKTDIDYSRSDNSHDDKEGTKFREQYLYRPNNTQGDPTNSHDYTIAIFGLQDGCGLKVFHQFFDNVNKSVSTLTSRYYKNVDIRVKVLRSTEKEQRKVLVNPNQSNTHRMTSTAYKTLGELENGPLRYVVVFDASFHRFSGDCVEALTMLENCFGKNVWKCTTLVIVNAEQMIGKETTKGYFEKEKDSDFGHWASKMGNGVLALPSSDNDYALELVKKELEQLLSKSELYYRPEVYQLFRWRCFVAFSMVKSLFGY